MIASQEAKAGMRFLVEHLALGLITEHLATNEVSSDFNNFSLQWRFLLFRPNGVLVTPETLLNFL